MKTTRPPVFLLFPLFCLLSVCAPQSGISADEKIGFIETFALAKDRTKALEQLIPGTEDYYYFHALHAQNLGKFADVETYFEPWLERYGETPRFREIRHRQMLMLYPENPKATLDYLKRELRLQFNHQQERLNAKPDLPTSLDPERVTWELYRQQAFRNSDTLQQVEDSGLDRLLRADVALDEKRLRDLLSRLRYPDYPRLAGLIASDLRSRNSRGFGEFEIHRRLLPAQLDELQRLHPPLRFDPNFVHLRLQQLRPSPDVDWTREPAEREAYLTRLWDRAKNLPSVFNSLKAHVLFQLLQHHHREGEHPRDLFLEYLRLPRQLAYVEPAWIRDPERQRFPVDLNANFTEITACPPIVDDEPLVRAYLLHFFNEAENFDGYSPYIRDNYLKALFAEAKLTNGIGDAARWYSLLSPAAVQNLKDRVDIEFAAGNPETFAPDDPVSLDVFVKNVSDLSVKIYEINSLNFFLEEKRELNTDLDLDGLVPNEENLHEFDEAPIRRVRRTFTFDSLSNQCGAWVIEFIGNGRSSRALVRKGRLQYLSEVTPAGLAVSVLTQDNLPAKSPSIWFGGREYHPQPESDFILLPFTNQPGASPVVLTDGDFATLEILDLPRENYFLKAGFHVEQETLIPGKIARLAVRPDLQVNGQPASVSILDSPKLTLTTTDHDGIESVMEIPGFALFDDRESVHEFRVPERLAKLTVALEAKVEKISSGGTEQTLRANREFEVNGIDSQRYIADSHLSRIDGEWVLEVLGKTGEPLADRAIDVQTKHKDFRNPQNFALKTNAQGRISLSSLPDHQWITLGSGEGLPHRTWHLEDFEGENYLPASIHGKAGEPVQVPVSRIGGDAPISPEDLALFETRAGVFVENRFENAEWHDDGILHLTGLTPGNYELRLRGAEKSVAIRVTAAEVEGKGYALSKWRHLQIKNPAPLQIASLEKTDDHLNLRLANSDNMTRVHLIATHFVPRFSLRALGSPNRTEPITVTPGTTEALYLSGRDIGEEYRYILERRSARKFPGNLLPRPELLLNPWALRDTETSIDQADAGEDYEKKADAAKSRREAAAGSAGMAGADPFAAPAPPVTPGYEFMQNQAPLVYNLVPDKDGLISIDLADLGDRQHVHVIAVNQQDSAYRQISLAEGDGSVLRDLRLTKNLDSSKHFSQRQQVTILNEGDTLTLPDIRSSEFETYGTLADTWSALSAVHEGNDAEKLATFAFVLNWPDTPEEKKRELYSEHACHELNFFLSRHDPDFFATVVRPYLSNKRHKTFLDDYLTGAALEKYTEPWAFGRLNIVEKILLARRLGGAEPTATARHVRELTELMPVPPQRASYLFRSALRGKSSQEGQFGEMEEAMLLEEAPAPEGEARRLGRNMGAAGVALPAAAKPAAPPAPMVAAEPFADTARAGGSELDATQRGAMAISLAKEVRDLRQLRDSNRALFRKLEATKEWAENNYYHLPIAEQSAGLVTANAFWRDYAAWNGQGNFYSRDFPTASRNFSEMMFALSVLDLPFTEETHDLTIDDGELNLTAKSPLIAFHEEIEETPISDEPTPILVSQNFFRSDDRYAHVNGQQIDKFVTEEFLTAVLYGGQIVVTNPTSSSQDLEVLLQIPRGALPAAGSHYTDTRCVRLDAFSTQKLDFFFYFPESSPEDQPFPHYPAHVSQGEKVIAWAEPFSFHVVDQLSTLDKASWEYLSQFGTEEEVIAFLEQNNIYRINLARMAWRCRENPDFFRRVIHLLSTRHSWNPTLWSYGLYHNDTAVARQYLMHREDFLQQCGQWLEADLVSIDPVSRHWYQHLEYRPLVNARAHQLGRDRKILNNRFRSQYQDYLKVLSYQSEFPAEEQLGISYYLFLQDRVEEALSWLDKVDAAGIEADESRLQFDYLKAYAALYRESPADAGQIAARYTDYPVDRWKERFAQINRQVEEIRGNAEDPSDGKRTDDREQEQAALAASEPNFELETRGQTVMLDYRNIDRVRVNYYEMDLEFLFSSNPFVSENSDRFSFVRPNVTLLKELPKNQTETEIDIPDQFANRNVLVEIVGAGKKRNTAVYANALKTQLVENYGRLEVRDAQEGKPLPKVYVKVYGRFSNGEERFLKDGYTDLRGKFDYVSLNTNELDDVKKLSLLILSEEHGALVREVDPPRR